MRRILVLALVLAAACGGDSTTGPNQQTNVGGRWLYTATNVAGSGVSCNLSNVSMTLTQTGSTFTGTVASGSNLSCTGPGGSINESLGNDVIANGVVTGNSIQFDIGTQDLHNTGTVSGNSMSGNITIRIVAGATTINLAGTFSAVRQ